MFDDNASGIHFTTGRRHQRGSSNSLASMADSMRRVNTASSFFKRLLSRNDSQPATPASTDGPQLMGIPSASGRMEKSASNASLAGSKMALNLAPIRITDQVIEEVDEQMTITSMRQEVRPKAEDLFNQGPMTTLASNGPPPPSKPVDVPMKSLGGGGPPRERYSRTFSTVGQNMNEKDEFIGGSAPSTQFQPPTPPGYDEYDRHSKEGTDGGGGGGLTVGGHVDGDDFERLRIARERERNDRQRMNIARSISTTPGSTMTNLNTDLVDALAATIADDLSREPGQEKEKDQSSA